MGCTRADGPFALSQSCTESWCRACLVSEPHRAAWAAAFMLDAGACLQGSPGARWTNSSTFSKVHRCLAWRPCRPEWGCAAAGSLHEPQRIKTFSAGNNILSCWLEDDCCLLFTPVSVCSCSDSWQSGAWAPQQQPCWRPVLAHCTSHPRQAQQQGQHWGRQHCCSCSTGQQAAQTAAGSSPCPQACGAQTAGKGGCIGRGACGQASAQHEQA